MPYQMQPNPPFGMPQPLMLGSTQQQPLMLPLGLAQSSAPQWFVGESNTFAKYNGHKNKKK